MNKQNDNSEYAKTYSRGFKEGEREAIFTQVYAKVPMSITNIVSESIYPIYSQQDSPAPIQSSTGKWTREEHANFLHALEIFGMKWPAIQRFVLTRSGVQIRSHAQKFFAQKKKSSPEDTIEKPESRKKRFIITKGFSKSSKGRKLSPEETLLIETYMTCCTVLKKMKEVSIPFTAENDEFFDLPPLGLVSEEILKGLHSPPSTKSSTEKQIPELEVFDLDNMPAFDKNMEEYPIAAEPALGKFEPENCVSVLCQEAAGFEGMLN